MFQVAMVLPPSASWPLVLFHSSRILQRTFSKRCRQAQHTCRTGRWFTDRSTYKRLASQLGVPTTPERQVGAPAGGARERNSGRAHERFDMTPTRNFFAALQETEEVEGEPEEPEDVEFGDEELAERLRSASHPSSGRRQNSKVQQHRLVRVGSTAPRCRRGV